MPEATSADVTAELLLWYYEEPRRYRAEGRRRDAPILESAVVLKLALGRRVDFARAELREPATTATLRDAAGMYVRFLFFRPDATPYQVLGLTSGATPEAIKESFRLIMHLVHPDRQDERVVWPESYAALANRAYGILRDQDSRVRFDREAQARAASARAINRTSEAARASRMPVPVRPKRRKRGPLDGVVLPEWLTAGVGGFAREHPSVTAFTALIGAAVVAVTLMVWGQHDGALTRDLDASSDASSGASLARLPSLSWFSSAASAPVVSAPSPASAANPGVKRTPPIEAKAMTADVKPADTMAPSGGADSPAPSFQTGLNTAQASDATAVASSPPPAPPTSGETPPPARAGAAEATSLPPMIAAAKVEPVAAPPRMTAAPEPAPSPPRQAAAELAMPAASSTAGASHTVTAQSMVATAAASPPVSGPAPMMARVDPTPTTIVAPGPQAVPPATSEIETLFATFVESYERGRVDIFADLFDVDAEANLRRGRPAIRGEYDELFRLSQWRRMQLTRVNWKRVGNGAVAKGEITVKIGWRDGREVEQRIAMDMELVRRDGRVVIAKLSQQPRP